MTSWIPPTFVASCAFFLVSLHGVGRSATIRLLGAFFCWGTGKRTAADACYARWILLWKGSVDHMSPAPRAFASKTMRPKSNERLHWPGHKSITWRGTSSPWKIRNRQGRDVMSLCIVSYHAQLKREMFKRGAANKRTSVWRLSQSIGEWWSAHAQRTTTVDLDIDDASARLAMFLAGQTRGIFPFPKSGFMHEKVCLRARRRCRLSVGGCECSMAIHRYLLCVRK
jgi:hypothetical protein